jgi:hypothetical protein
VSESSVDRSRKELTEVSPEFIELYDKISAPYVAKYKESMVIVENWRLRCSYKQYRAEDYIKSICGRPMEFEEYWTNLIGPITKDTFRLAQ